MSQGQEIDMRIARDVFGYELRVVKNVLHEITPIEVRPLPQYSRDVAAAWAVVERMNVALLPVAGGYWFAMVGRSTAWKSPSDFLQFLQEVEFVESGAAIGVSVAETICIAALNAIDKRKGRNESDSENRETTDKIRSHSLQ